MRDMLFLFDIRNHKRKAHHQELLSRTSLPAPGGLVSGHFSQIVLMDQSVSQGSIRKGDFNPPWTFSNNSKVTVPRNGWHLRGCTDAGIAALFRRLKFPGAYR